MTGPERTLRRLLELAIAVPALSRRASSREIPWQVELQVVSSPVMTRLNARYRGKRSTTDVLSFPAPAVFQRQGMLGSLVICDPVLKRQAREHGHSAAREWEVLLVHGLLHLLDFDHERGPGAARTMARWEARLLAGLRPKVPKGAKARAGLIGRSRSRKLVGYE